MFVLLTEVSRHNLKNSLKCLRHVNNRFFLQNKLSVRNHKTMAQKVSQNKTYIAVNIPENSNKAVRKSFWSVFKRDASTKKSKEAPKEVAPATPRINKADLARLLSLAKPEKWKLFGAICFLLVSSTVTMSIPFSLGKVLDIIYSSSENSDEARAKLNKVCGVLLCVFVLGAICNFGRVYLMSVSGYRMTQALRKRVFSTIMKQEQGWFDKRSTGELVNRLSADTQIVGNALSSNISDGLRSIVMVCAGTGMMFYMSAELALVGLAIVPPVAIIAVIYGRFLRGISRKVQDSLAGATSVAEERIANIRTVKTFSQEPREVDSYANAIKEVLGLSYREAKARAIFYGLTGFSGHVIIISVLYYGGVMVSSNTITVGNLSSFLLYAAYIGVSLGTFSNFYSELNKSIGAAARIWEIIDREPIIPMKGGLVPIAPPEGHIQFNDIQFSYPARDDVRIFENFKLEISPGKMVAVVGPSGSGKSTLAALLLRLYDPAKGQVLLDGQDIKEIDPSWLRRHVGTVSQEPVLFSCSIRDNILYGADDPSKVTEDELVQVAKEANVYEFVQQLPDGFDTLVGERGVMLSGGQKQRIAIARALIKDPKILLLDEATSALDAQSEHLVQEALERIMKGRTVLTIAHRLSTIQNADTIAVLRDGHIVEQGKYQDLLNIKKGAFRELMKHQTFQGNIEKT
ncbi:ATP-binding cassette sub-family B member 10, mitochondrial isoform X2 [Tribolium castaneum]|uniref:ATP-binding cassette sub-family B member 10, mitochondrial isoform X2 n=1 Tax=Tribolium castaneum TaxID=7070 RepID=UPI00046C12E1|nr:PREDICTED: ATP-binding cassette sub-family B member 10, mitochondrial isoform X2 [Tribolium castaneum]|eukprot:XP_008192744.1 PREDICTED: ATP-binding cassette sub-family B member 10, mitochondrial isoform X2 [Tribolium castaneum]